MSLAYIDRLPEKVKIRTIGKLSNVARCKLRRTCKALDAFVEEHRFQFTKWSEDGFFFTLLVGDGVLFLRQLDAGAPDLPIENPYKQLSAIYIFGIAVNAPNYIVPSEEALQELFSLMGRLKLATYSLQSFLTCHFAAETTLSFVSLCASKNLEFILNHDIPIDKFFALDTPKNSGTIRLRKPRWDEVPVQGFLEKIMPYGTMHIEVTTVGRHIYENVLPQYVMDASIHDGPVPVFKIEAQEFRDPKSIFPNLLEVFRKPESHQEMIRIYAQKFNEKLLLIKSCELNIGGFKFLYWSILFSEKEKDELKKILEDLTKEEMDDEILDHMFANILSLNE